MKYAGQSTSNTGRNSNISKSKQNITQHTLGCMGNPIHGLILSMQNYRGDLLSDLLFKMGFLVG